ncbi:uncharacterized protein N7500_003227 [Penicillium coprophilum]|uniref:uncharacterized protein n=1 Tax=Penicillium coprophilum TaxID=36646 RepID=UPI0023913F4F|nr:uncharacterized protein N7500_003227 [Penicillium coprophilum]KAJ5170444.1 hypothetical protein N7500_003227 [Penicillium coprophilum]
MFCYSLLDIADIESRLEYSVEGAIQPQEVGQVARTINTEEALALALGVGALKPRDSKSSRFKRLTSIPNQKGLDFRIVHLQAKLNWSLRSLFTELIIISGNIVIAISVTGTRPSGSTMAALPSAQNV